MIGKEFLGYGWRVRNFTHQNVGIRPQGDDVRVIAAGISRIVASKPRAGEGALTK
jgi:hypothetical protein